MDKYRVIYRCGCCNSVSSIGDALEMDKDGAKSLCEEVIRNQIFQGNPYLHKAPMHVLHMCSDGSVGIASFAGLERVR